MDGRTDERRNVGTDGNLHAYVFLLKQVRQKGCFLSPTLFNIFLERIMTDALEEHAGKVSIGGRNISNLQFANETVALADEQQELEALVESLDKTCRMYKTEISAERPN